ncbi:MAG: polysaccharide deacetylase family protein [Armatimonadetes bacterium]|nr:polysaccharide deacetylase family protein [Armatimonadota bacterium]
MLRRIGYGRTIIELGLVAAVIFLAVERPPQAQPPQESVIYKVRTNQKVVALTYDDGPDPRFTPGLLRVLDKYGVKATFFMIGRRMEKYPDIVRDVVKAGHVIANHTYTHPSDIALDTPAQVIRELDSCEQLIERLTGKRAGLFRPPKGLMDGSVLTVADEEGYKTVLWSVSADHHEAKTPEAMANRVISRIHPGLIILAHDGAFASRWRDVAATAIIIESLRKRGYRFVTVPELLDIGSKVGI